MFANGLGLVVGEGFGFLLILAFEIGGETPGRGGAGGCASGSLVGRDVVEIWPVSRGTGVARATFSMSRW